MEANNDKKKRKKRVWGYPEEEFLIQLWPKYTCLYKTTSKDFKRSDKKCAAYEDIRRSLQEQFPDEPFTGILQSVMFNTRLQTPFYFKVFLLFGLKPNVDS